MAAIVAIWAFYTGKIAPARIGQQSDAFKQVLSINETLISAFINGLDKMAGAIAGLEKAIEAGYGSLVLALKQLEKTINALDIIRVVSNLRTQIEINNRERAQVEEVMTDIDLILHKHEALLSQISDRIDALNERLSQNDRQK